MINRDVGFFFHTSYSYGRHFTLFENGKKVKLIDVDLFLY